MADIKPTGLALLRLPFEAHQISKLPRPYKKESPKGNCTVCGGYHGLPAMHLDYVGHAALTDRLLDVDPNWYWEPLAYAENGLPQYDSQGGLWIKLHVCGVVRLGYGHAGDKHGGDAIKEVIGDALRNAAMRFGAALELWHKGELHKPSQQELIEADKGEIRTPNNFGLSPARAKLIRAATGAAIKKFNAGDLYGAYEEIQPFQNNNDELLAFSSALSDQPTLRNELTRMMREERDWAKRAASGTEVNVE